MKLKQIMYKACVIVKSHLKGNNQDLFNNNGKLEHTRMQ